MKVSEAETALARAFLDLENVVMPPEVFDAIKTLLASHEALRLAGEAVVAPLVQGEFISNTQIDNLALAVESASR